MSDHRTRHRIVEHQFGCKHSHMPVPVWSLNPAPWFAAGRRCEQANLIERSQCEDRVGHRRVVGDDERRTAMRQVLSANDGRARQDVGGDGSCSSDKTHVRPAPSPEVA